MRNELRDILLFVIILSAPLAHAVDLTAWMNAMDLARKDIKQVNEKKGNISLIFVYSSTCPYCKKFAPTLKEFANELGLKVESVTADGGLLNGFEDAIYSQELAESMGVKSYPTLFAIDSNTGRFQDSCRVKQNGFALLAA